MFSLSMLTLEDIKSVVGKGAKDSNIRSVLTSLHDYGSVAGLDQPHRIVHFLCQLAHESGGFRYDKEVWGATPAQLRYEGRKDLGNIQDGDGEKFSGRGPIQLTGRRNVTAFYKWCVAKGMSPPDFVENPNLINDDPWEGLSAIWFWDVGNQTGKSLNIYADKNDIENITRKINGGLNGYADRLNYYDKFSLSILGFSISDIVGFQRASRLIPDGMSGPLTRAEMHKQLVKMVPTAERSDDVAKSPVVTEKPVAVAPTEVDKPSKDVLGTVLTVGLPSAGTALASVSSFNDTAQIILVSALVLAGFAAGAYVIWRRVSQSNEAKQIKEQIKEAAI